MREIEKIEVGNSYLLHNMHILSYLILRILKCYIQRKLSALVKLHDFKTEML